MDVESKPEVFLKSDLVGTLQIERPFRRYVVFEETLDTMEGFAHFRGTVLTYYKNLSMPFTLQVPLHTTNA